MVKRLAGLINKLRHIELTEDILIHAVVALAMSLVLLSMPPALAIPLAVVLCWYFWELGQRIAKDVHKRGALFWWNITRWSSTARLEFLAPALTAIVTAILYQLYQHVLI